MDTTRAPPAFASPTTSSERWHSEKAATREAVASSRGDGRGATHGAGESLATAWEPHAKGRLGAMAAPLGRAAAVRRSGPLAAGHAVGGEAIEDRLARLAETKAAALERQREAAALNATVVELREAKRVVAARHEKNRRSPRHVAAKEAVTKRAVLMATAGDDAEDGFAQTGHSGWGMELVAWKEHSHRRRRTQGQRSLDEAEAIVREFETPLSPSMSAGSIQICERREGIFSEGGRDVGERLHIKAVAQQARRDAAVAAAKVTSPERTQARSPSRTRQAATRVSAGLPLPTDPVGRERDARRQKAIAAHEASISFSPRVGRSPRGPASPAAGMEAGLRLHANATSVQIRRASARKDAHATAREQANPSVNIPSSPSSPSSSIGWEAYDVATSLYEEEDYVIALQRARLLSAQRAGAGATTESRRALLEALARQADVEEHQTSLAVDPEELEYEALLARSHVVDAAATAQLEEDVDGFEPEPEPEPELRDWSSDSSSIASSHDEFHSVIDSEEDRDSSTSDD